MAKHRVPIKQRQPGRASHPLMRYEQQVGSISIGTATAGDDFSYTLFDTSVRTSNKNSKVGKMTIQWFQTLNTQTRYYVAVYKRKEGATDETLDDTVSIRDMRSEGRLIRGPWMIGSVVAGSPAVGSLMTRKTIVLEDLLLDPNDDLAFGMTVVGGTSGTNTINLFVKTWWKVTE